MDVPTFLCLETSSVLRYLLLKRKRFHVNEIYVSREEFGDYHTLLEQADKFYEYFRMKEETIAISAHSFRATSLSWYCLSCRSHKLLLSWTKLIHVSQSIMIYVIIGRKKQTELNSTDLRPTSVVIGRQVGCIETKHVPSSWFEKIGRVWPTSVVGCIGRCLRHSDHMESFSFQ
jgi:hypothetical protein